MKTMKSQTAKSGGQNRESHGRMIRSKPSKGPESKRGSACVAIFWAPTRLLAAQHTPMPRGGSTNSQSLSLDAFDLPGCDRKISISHPVLAGAYCKVEVERWSFYLLVRVRDTLLDGELQIDGM